MGNSSVGIQYVEAMGSVGAADVAVGSGEAVASAVAVTVAVGVSPSIVVTGGGVVEQAISVAASTAASRPRMRRNETDERCVID